MELRNVIDPYCEALKKGIETENWYLSLMAAFTLPDICVSLEGVQGRTFYVDWFDKYITFYKPKVHQSKALKNAYTVDEYLEWIRSPSTLIGEDIEEVQLEYFSGVNAYALRCAFLHNGNGEVGTQEIYKQSKYKNATLGIKKVKFDLTNPNRVFSQFGDTARLNPKVYCGAILEGVERWITDNENSENVLDKAKNLQIFELP
jgi:hypothetical protein